MSGSEYSCRRGEGQVLIVAAKSSKGEYWKSSVVAALCPVATCISLPVSSTDSRHCKVRGSDRRLLEDTPTMYTTLFDPRTRRTICCLMGLVESLSPRRVCDGSLYMMYRKYSEIELFLKLLEIICSHSIDSRVGFVIRWVLPKPHKPHHETSLLSAQTLVQADVEGGMRVA